jgi:hypothetical protein
MSDTVQAALDAVRIAYPAAVDEYREASSGDNFHHSGKRFLVEIDRMTYELGCADSARRLGFKTDSVPAQPSLPNPFTADSPEASLSGAGLSDWMPKGARGGTAAAVTWEQLPQSVRDAADPGGFIAQFKMDYDEEMADGSAAMAPRQMPDEFTTAIALLGKTKIRTAKPAGMSGKFTLEGKDSVGDLLAITEVFGDDSAERYLLHQITGYVSERGEVHGQVPDDDQDRRGYHLRIVDSRLGKSSELHPAASAHAMAEELEIEIAELDWHPSDTGYDSHESALMAWKPLHMGKCTTILSLDQMHDDIVPGVPWTVPTAAWEVDTVGFDATSFWDKRTFLGFWRFSENPDAEDKNNIDWVFECPTGHG